MIVVDNTVLADWAFADSGRQAQAKRLGEVHPIWITTTLYRYELGNVAWKTIRFGHGWTRARAKAAMENVRFVIAEVVGELDWADVLALASERKLTFYDASYVWLARERKTVVYSRDAEMRRNCPEWVRAMDEF